jgi:uncharacterized protein
MAASACFAGRISPAAEALVKAKPYLSVDKLPPGGTCEVVIFVQIKPGWHIQGNDVKESWQHRTEVTLQSKLGATLEQVSYPKGRLSLEAGARQASPIYEEKAVIRGVINVPESAASRTDELKIVLDYQVCNSKECHPPQKLKMVATIPVAVDRDSVQPKNQNLFPRSER